MDKGCKHSRIEIALYKEQCKVDVGNSAVATDLRNMSVCDWVGRIVRKHDCEPAFFAVMIFLLAFNVCVNSDKDAGSCNAVEMQPRSTERSSS